MSVNNLHFLLEQTLLGFEKGCIATVQGEVLALNYEMLADIGTLGLACETTQKYLQPKLGDFILLNDPYSGGSLLSSVTLITKLWDETTSSPGLILASRIGYRPHVSLSDNIEEEGLRIPPTPIASGFVLNEAILEAIASHPLCPQGFLTKFKTTYLQMQGTVEKFNALLKRNPQLLDKTVIKKYLDKSQEILIAAISELPSGEIRVEESLDYGENIKLHLEIQDEKFALDFRGTSSSKRVCLTDSSTFGSCFGAIIAFLQIQVPLNSGAFKVLQVTSPLGSLLNAKYPSPTFKGMTDGTAIVASTVLKGLSGLMPSRETSMSAVAACKIELEFSNKQRFYDILPGGTGATSQKAGADGLALWLRNHLQPSVEEIERIFPLRVRKADIRENSGGKGQFQGGHGLVKQFELIEAAKLTWVLDQTKKHPSGLHGAQNGEPSQIYITFKNKTGKDKNKILPGEGNIELQPGDMVTVLSAGGGGWGKIPSA